MTNARIPLAASLCFLAIGCGLPGADESSGALSGASDPTAVAPLVPPASPDAYRLPWECGVSYVVSQGNNGDECGILGNHQGIEKYAWDFGLPLHTRVLAARAGTVTLAATYSPPGSACFNGCPNDKGGSDLEQEACCTVCLFAANRVNVAHSGGDISSYSHLSEVLVAEGQHVEAGDLLGYSGTSGCSTGPHMHFQIMRGCETGYCQSVPMSFDDAGVPACGDHPLSQNNCK
jgi:murein DD-endopeptidase MepM/ murein hydrolase activator NlpD